MSVRIDLTTLAPDEQARPAAALAAAGLACFPTDTVYGIGGRLAPATAAAVADAVVRVKGRDPGKPLQVVFPTLERLLATVALTPALRDAAACLLPGPFTLVVPYPDGLDCPAPGVIEGIDGAEVRTLGVRVPTWPAGARALAGLPFPLLASSANLSGGPEPARLDDVEPAVRAACDLLLDGGPVGGVSSTVLDLTGYERGRAWRILRRGAAGVDTVAALLGGDRPGRPGGRGDGGERKDGEPR